jgi:Uncharacterized protein conserved in bacteria
VLRTVLEQSQFKTSPEGSNMDMETRLTRLEEQLYFQEHAVQELHEALLAQQKQIDRMESVLKRMADRQQKLLDMLEDKPENTLPPHYMPERY